MIILDTNVLSEALKPEPSDRMMRWLAAQDPFGLYTTAITQAELLYGVELLPPGRRRASLTAAVQDMLAEDLRTSSCLLIGARQASSPRFSLLGRKRGGLSHGSTQ